MNSEAVNEVVIETARDLIAQGKPCNYRTVFLRVRSAGIKTSEVLHACRTLKEEGRFPERPKPVQPRSHKADPVVRVEPRQDLHAFCEDARKQARILRRARLELASGRRVA